MVRYLKKFVETVFWSVAALWALAFLFGIVAIIAALGSGEGVDQLDIKTDRAVGVAKLEGEILSSETFRKDMQKFLDNEKVKAVVVRIDSPGGTVGASEEIHRAIVAANAKKPVICSLGNLAASGGLYSAVGCRKVITNKGTLTGSIGVIFMTPNVASLVEKVGVSMQVIKSGKFKDAGSPFRASNPEERELLQSLVDASYEQFLDVIARGRNLDKEKVRQFADGRIVLGEQAVAWGLADAIGGLEDAAGVALSESGYAGTESPEIVYLPEAEGLRAVFKDVKGRAQGWVSLWSRPTLLYRAELG